MGFCLPKSGMQALGVLGRVRWEPTSCKLPLTKGAGARERWFRGAAGVQAGAGVQWLQRWGFWLPSAPTPSVMSAKRESPRPTPGPQPISGLGPSTRSLPASCHPLHSLHPPLSSASLYSRHQQLPADSDAGTSPSCVSGLGLIFSSIRGAGGDLGGGQRSTL